MLRGEKKTIKPKKKILLRKLQGWKEIMPVPNHGAPSQANNGPHA